MKNPYNIFWQVFRHLLLFFFLSTDAWSYVTVGKVSVVATTSSAGVSSTSQDSTISENLSSGNIGIGSTAPSGSLDVPGTICFSHSCLSAWPAGGAQTSGTNMLFGNGSGGYTNVATTATAGGNVGIGTLTPGQKLDVLGTVRATHFSGTLGGTRITGLLVSTPYQAATDGFAEAVISIADNANNSPNNCSLWTDTVSPPDSTGIRHLAGIDNAASTNTGGYVPVSAYLKKNEYYQVDCMGGATLNMLQFVPVGA